MVLSVSLFFLFFIFSLDFTSSIFNVHGDNLGSVFGCCKIEILICTLQDVAYLHINCIYIKGYNFFFLQVPRHQQFCGLPLRKECPCSFLYSENCSTMYIQLFL
ncbi:hypothetical protein J3Q64DRAFT_1746468 [Phycomyces blakesleeanus]|uniref:Secreted protein n=1 Tax=Phycomyces blakesleeanus TaxID=4837 RepID=A0ABR3AXR4_PHYBL